MIYLTDEQAQQIEDAIELSKSIYRVHGIAYPSAYIDVLETIGSARAQDVTSQNLPWIRDEDVESFNAWLSLFVEGRIKEAMTEASSTHNRESFADALEAAYWEFDARVKDLYGSRRS